MKQHYFCTNFLSLLKFLFCLEIAHLVQASLKLLILLSFLHERWDYRYGPPCPVYVNLTLKPRASCMLGKHSADWATQPFDTLHLRMQWLLRSIGNSGIQNHTLRCVWCIANAACEYSLWEFPWGHNHSSIKLNVIRTKNKGLLHVDVCACVMVQVLTCMQSPESALSFTLQDLGQQAENPNNLSSLSIRIMA